MEHLPAYNAPALGHRTAACSGKHMWYIPCKLLNTAVLDTSILCLQVLEGWLQWAAMGVMQHAQAAQAVLVLVENLGAKLHVEGKVGWLSNCFPGWYQLGCCYGARGPCGSCM
jgi:hypothetical protein